MDGVIVVLVGEDPVIAAVSSVRELDVDGCLTLYRGADRVLVLNETASDVWRLCDGERRLGEITGLLARAYAVEPAAIDGDVRAAVERFSEEGFVRDAAAGRG